MGWIVWSFVAVLITGVAVALSRIGSREEEQRKQSESDGRRPSRPRSEMALKLGGRVVAFGIPALWVLTTFLSSFNTVSSGEVGIVRTFGEITSQRGEGLQILWPWQNLSKVDTRNLKFSNSSPSDPAIEAFSKESIDVFVRTTLVYHVNDGAVQQLVRRSGTNFFERLAISSLILQAVKEETVKYDAIEIAPNRAAIRAAVEGKLKAELNARSIEIDRFTIDNIDFAKSFKDAIDAKARVSQQAAEAQAQVARKKAEADQAIETARGEGESNRVRAEKEGEAIRLKADAEAYSTRARGAAQAAANTAIAGSLTPEVIQFTAVQTLGDNIQIALIPSGSGLILDPTSLLSGVKK